MHQIGETIVAELEGMVDYHNARVYILDDDGRTLEPIAFRGTIDEYEGETLDALRVSVGEGITGAAAARGKTLNVPDANACPSPRRSPARMTSTSRSSPCRSSTTGTPRACSCSPSWG